MIIADRLKLLRKQKNLHQKEIANVLGISLTGYASYEQGKAKPSLDILMKLSEYYNVSTDYLVGKTDIPYTECEKEFFKELHVKDVEELVNQYQLVLGDHTMSEDEKRTMIKMLKAYLEKD